jgi:amino acid transporter
VKVFGGVTAFFGIVAVVAGISLILLSLKNMNDLNMWFGLGLCLGVTGAILALVGWRLGSFATERTRDDGDSSRDS